MLQQVSVFDDNVFIILIWGLFRYSNLNGVYFHSEVDEHKSFHWDKPKSLKHAKMMIRPKAVSQ